MNDSTDLPQLRVTCLRLLAAYVFEADRTLKLLASIKKFPMTPKERRALFEQQQKENDAYRDYQFARVELFKLASRDETHCSYDSIGATAQIEDSEGRS